MSALAGLVDILSLRESATSPGSYTDFANQLFTFPSGGPNPETLPNAGGVPLRSRSRDEYVMTIYDISNFAAFNTLMVARAKLDMKWTFGDSVPTTWTFNPMRFTVKPLFDLVPNTESIWIGATDATNDPDTTPADWDDLGTMFEDNTVSIDINQKGDGLALPYYHSVRFSHNFKLANDVSGIATLLDTYDRAKCKIAIGNPDGKWLIYSGVTLQYENRAELGEDGFVVYDVTLGALKQNITDIITIPASAPDYLYGWELAVQAASAAQSDYLTIVDS